MYKTSKVKSSKSKEKIRAWAVKVGRKVLWVDKKGFWHAAKDRFNTPLWSTETEDVE